jgi:hypothetical protein
MDRSHPALEPPTSGKCCFFTLPPELRNKVYDIVIRSCRRRRICGARTLCSAASMVGTCKQIRQEARSNLDHYMKHEAKHFVTTIVANDFYDLKAGLRKIPSLEGAEQRSLRITLYYDADEFLPDWEELADWAQYASGLQAWDCKYEVHFTGDYDECAKYASRVYQSLRKDRTLRYNAQAKRIRRAMENAL